MGAAMRGHVEPPKIAAYIQSKAVCPTKIPFQGRTALPPPLYSCRGKYYTPLCQENTRRVCMRFHGYASKAIIIVGTWEPFWEPQ